MRILDLFCGAGGAAMGYHRAGFEVVGVDITPQPNYPFKFWRQDALEILRWYPVKEFDAIHASPPCQCYSDLQKQNKREYPDLIAPTRDALRLTGLPYVIENVEGAPLIEPKKLCGANDDYFPDLSVIRHRLFESNFSFPGVPCPAKHPLVFTYDKRKAHYGQLDQNGSYVQVTGGGNCTVANAKRAMGIDWMTKDELNEAIPPAYTHHIGLHLSLHIQRERLAA